MNQVSRSKPLIEQLPIDKYLREIYPNLFSEDLSDWVSALLLKNAVTPINNCSISISQYNTRIKIEQRLKILKDKHYFHARVELNALKECSCRALFLSRASENFANLTDFTESKQLRVSNRYSSLSTNYEKVKTRLKHHRAFCKRYKTEMILLEHQLLNCVKSVNLLSFFEILDQEEAK